MSASLRSPIPGTMSSPRARPNKAGAARRMGEADRIVGQLQIAEKVILAAAPDGAIAVLVGGVLVDDRRHDLALGVVRVGIGDVAGAVALWIGPGTEGYFRNLKISNE